MKNRELLSSGNPFKAVIVFSIPSILAMLVNAIYNIVDKIFIGNFVGEDALAGLQVVNPLTFYSFALMVMFGLGSASYASNKLGEGKDKEANKIFNNGLVFSFFLIIFVSVLFFIFRNPLLKLGGADDKNYSYAYDYFICLIFGFIFQSLSYFFTMNIRSEGRPVISMFAQITGCVMNVLLDALFIVVFKWGAFGAALATVLGHVSNFLVGLWFYTISKKNYFKIDIKDGIKIDWDNILQISTVGLSSAILNLCNGTSVIIYNNVIGKYDNALSILAILTSLDSIAIMPCVGIRQGLLPIMSYNYGEKKYDRMFKLFMVGIIYGCIYGIFACSMIMIFPEFFIRLFVDNESQALINEAIRICRFYPLGISIITFNMNAAAVYQASRAKLKSSLISAMRQCLYLIPLLYIFDASLGQSGVWYAMPISDLLSALSAIIFILTTYFCYKKCGYLSKKDKKKYELE